MGSREHECPTCICGRRAPVQSGYQRGLPRTRDTYKPPGTITWSEHLEVWAAYAAQYGTDQSAERLAERGGFGYYEAEEMLGRALTTWEPTR